MPKIAAATLAEHQAAQRRALVAAAMETLLADGAAAITPAAVGRRAGLARSSVYQYFPSTAALVAAVIEEAFPPWDAALGAALDGVEAPAARIDAYVEATLRLTAEGHHRAAGALLNADLPPEVRRRLAELHRATTEPLSAAVRALGVPEPELTARLLGGLLSAAMAAIEGGADAEVATARVKALLAGELGG
ncbi:TetR/AcrR family transcriptional regulator [Catenulispora yoronensis]|uniref:TetR/AcrR family transcriptional regulator n=1 Tax=Catenulispora yoronensis TaxID=450799 RepID=A0ABN2VCC6_9ACTN